MKTSEKNYLKQKWSIAGFLLSQHIAVKIFPNYLEFILNKKLCRTIILKRRKVENLKPDYSKVEILIKVWNLEQFIQMYSLNQI